MRAAYVERVPMRLLLVRGCLRGHYSQQGLEACHGEPTGRGRKRSRACETRGSDRKHPFDTWVEPHDTDTSQPLLRGHSNQREGEAIQRVCGISHFYRIGGKCGKLERGSLMYSF